MLNSFFSSVFTQETLPIPELEEHDINQQLLAVYFTAENLKNKILALKQDSAPGPDSITARFLRETADIISEPLAIMFARSMEEGWVPDDWRKANVTPISSQVQKLFQVITDQFF